MAGFTFAIGVLGCRSNQEEVDCLRSQMMEMGGAEVRFPGPADVVVVNSCAVTATALSQSRQETRKAGRAKTGGLLIVTGCGVQMDPAWMARLEGVDLVAGNRAKERLGSLLEDLASFGPADAPFSSAALEELLAAGGETKRLHECRAGELPPTGWRPAFGPRDVGRGSWLLWEADPLPDRFARRTGPIPTRNSRAVLKIQDGCHFKCAFCIVSSLRGEPRSRDRREVTDEARRLSEAGFREIVLTGINLGLYGYDGGPAHAPATPPGSALADLLRDLACIDGIERIRLSSLEPMTITETLLDRIAETPKVARHFHIPFQSGDNQVLRRMRRPYGVTALRRLVTLVRERFPVFGLGADIVAGFPGEDEEAFSRTVELLKEFPMTYLHAFGYSERPGTSAAQLDGDVPHDQRRRRVQELRALDQSLRLRFQRRLEGQRCWLVVESSQSGGFQGLSGEYVRMSGRARKPRAAIGSRLSPGGRNVPVSSIAPCMDRQRRMGTYCIETYGCQMNLADSELIARVLEGAGWTPATGPEDSDLVLVNTCTVRERAAERVIGRVRSMAPLKALRPEMLFVIAGCLPQHLGAELAERLPEVDLFVGPDGYRKLPDLLGQAVPREKLEVNRNRRETYDGISPLRAGGVNAWVSIMRGCDRVCTYCAVPLARGRERSLPASSVIQSVAEAASGGFPSVTLLGQAVTSYRDRERDFAWLLGQMDGIEGLRRLRFLSAHPADFSGRLLEAMAASRVAAGHIHLPLQSGADRVLEAMRRGYTRAFYLDIVRRAREILPGVAITTDLIVGFPGESHDEFLQTIEVMEMLRFDSAFMFAYSPRKRTYAARFLEDDVHRETKGERLRQMIDLQEQHSLQRFSEKVGMIVEVLVEGAAKGSPELRFGRSDDFKAVVFKPPQGRKSPAASLVRVEITAASSHTLKGRQIP